MVNNETKSIKYENIELLCELLECSPNDLFEKTEDTKWASDFFGILNFSEKGVKNIKVYDVSDTDISTLISESFRCSNIVLLSTTYNMVIFPKIEEYLNDIQKVNLQNRTFSIIENSTWSPGISKTIKSKIQEMKNMTILEDNFSIKSSMKSEQSDDLKNLINNIVNNLQNTNI